MSDHRSGANLQKQTSKLEKELAVKTRDLNIEAALERVRAIAARLRKPSDLSAISGTIYRELKSLGFASLRNAEVIINNNVTKTITSYYSDYGKNGIIEVDYRKNAILKKWAEDAQKSNGAFVEVKIPEKEMKRWRKYREKIGYKPDAKLNKAKTIYYYSYSTGLGALTISSFTAISKEQTGILKRFRNVFQLSYRRYRDTALAEAQTREAKIQLALERVRARTLAMRKSAELKEATLVLFQQFKALGTIAAQVSICVFDDEVKMGEMFATLNGKKIDRSFQMELDQEAFVMKKARKAFLKKERAFSYAVKGKELQEYNRWRNSLIGKKGWDESNAVRRQSWHVDAVFFSRGMMGISSGAPASAETLQLLERFAKLFDLTYTRFLDLQKAEEQAREAQVQASLERVRASAMAMHKSEDLLEVCKMMHKEFLSLGFSEIRNAIINIHNDADNSFTNYDYTEEVGENFSRVANNVLPFVNKIIKTSQGANDAFSETYITGKALNEFKRLRKHLGQKDDQRLNKAESLYFYFYSIGVGSIGISTFGKIDDEKKILLRRFRNVFNLSYQRYVDISKAEAQAKEAKIEAALERVRSKAMAMQTSQELNALIGTVFAELTKLDIALTRCVIIIYDAATNDAHWWMANSEAPEAPVDFFVKYSDLPFFNEYLNGWHQRALKWQHKLEGNAKVVLDDFLFTETDLARLPRFVIDGMRTPHCIYINASFNNFGNLTLASLEPLSDEHFDILVRFAKVFDLTYTRFNDLKLSEAQKREAQIDLALERVRAKTMGMHKSADLLDVINLLSTQFQILGFKIHSANFNTSYREKDWNLWLYNPGTPVYPEQVRVPYIDHPFFNRNLEALANGADFSSFVFTKEEKNGFLDHLYANTIAKNAPAERKKFSYGAPGFAWSTVYLKNTALTIANYDAEPYTDEQNGIIRRFGNVFEQSYTRFLDLQKAEAQAREAQVEAALERVRYRAMAMQNSEDVGSATAVVFEEISLLNIETLRCGVAIFREDKMADVWAATSTEEGKKMRGVGSIDMRGHPVWTGLYEAWVGKKENFLYHLKGEDLKNYYRILATQPNYKAPYVLTDDLPDHYFYANFFEEGGIFTFSIELHDDEKQKILSKFTNVFALTFRRYQDLEKAEAQAREAQIELSLERVRAKTMSMHNSHDVGETVAVMFDELRKLGIEALRCGIGIMHDAKRMELWTAKPNETGKVELVVGYINMILHPLLQGAYHGWKDKLESFSYELKGDDLVSYFTAINNHAEYPVQYDISALPTTIFHNDFYFSEGTLFAFTSAQLSDAFRRILKRFAAVFGQTYRRYLDLQRAEAQAKEALVETGLERVRARTMAMHSSDDVSMATATMFTELEKLGIENFRGGFTTFKEDMTHEVWSVNNMPEGKVLKAVGIFDMKAHPFWLATFKEWKLKKDFFYAYLSGKEKEDYVKMLNTAPNYLSQAIVAFPNVHFYIYFFGEGAVWSNSLQPHSEEDKQVMKRFASVFSLTFRRYRDLQKAEANFREAKIESAMEKVRGRAMAMQKADELMDVAQLLRKEMGLLGVEELETSSIYIHDEESGTTQCWYAIQDVRSGDKNLLTDHMIIHLGDTWVGNEMLKFYRSGQMQTSILMQGENRKEWINYCARHSTLLDGYYGDVIPERTYHLIKFSGGYMGAASPGTISAESWDVLKRATTVFSLAYTRFSDLQLAEAQAREATIEAALERVRAKAMAMHNSNDLSSASGTVFTELRKLGINPIRCGVGIISKENRKAQLYSARESLSLIGWVMLSGHPVFEKIYQSYLNNEEYYPELSGEQLKTYYEKLLAGLAVPVPDVESGAKQFGHFLPCSVGCLYAWSETRYSEEEIRILRRFASIIDLTFRRYMELQKSEANAREAVKQAALDRVRADIASMRTITDLDRITPLIWNELNILGIPFIRCGVFIMDDSQQLIHTFLSTPDGKAIAAFHIPYNTPGNISQVIHHWHHKRDYIDHWDDSAFTEFAATLVRQGALPSPEQYLKTIPHGGFYLHFLPFLQGMLYVGNTNRLGDEEIQLIQSVADAFSTAYARYEDFVKLEAAKQRVEKTLVDLKQAQQQLVQSEKMASLGELTAGIAHEIQNPLNFVNNFSDVSSELLEEMKLELEKGNKQDAIAIVEDVKQNLQKILHHGKRADAIVKGMLQHSRTNSGQKEPTELNLLVDEYLRLAYHGLRAKDKSFSARFETHFDESIGKIEIIPQEMGRVILNLINNAFYAVTEKRRGNVNGYDPVVTVSTKRSGSVVELTVTDNGNGIPPKIMDKIFQPFFTTKPTGQGTGLGLSLAYDVVKAHGGDIRVETKEGEGSEFIIQLLLA